MYSKMYPIASSEDEFHKNILLIEFIFAMQSTFSDMLFLRIAAFSYLCVCPRIDHSKLTRTFITGIGGKSSFSLDSIMIPD